ncbi:MAG: alpha/beta hydrolase, partial [Candidatus Methylomirabilota bacterium]
GRVPPPRSVRARLLVGVTRLLRLASELPGCDGLLRPLLARWVGRVGSRDYRAAGAMRPTLVRLVNEEMLPLLSAIQAPTLILWGDQDQEVGRAAMERMRTGIAGARLVVLPGAGHFPFADAPVAFEGHLLPFLAEGGRP